MVHTCGQYGIVEAVYFKETPGGEKVGTKLPQTDTRNVDVPELEVREAMQGRETCIHELEEMAETYKKLREVEISSKKDFLEDGIQVQEVESGVAKQKIVEQLRKDLGIEENSNTIPGYNEHMKEVLDKQATEILEGNIEYEKVVENMKSGREEGGRTPGDKSKRE